MRSFIISIIIIVRGSLVPSDCDVTMKGEVSLDAAELYDSFSPPKIGTDRWI